MKRIIFLLSLFFMLLNTVLAQDIQREYSGTVARALVNDDVNVRKLPTTKSTSIKQLGRGNVVIITGISNSSEIIDGYQGMWLRISLSENAAKYYVENNGWVFSRYVDIAIPSRPAVFSVSKVVPANSQYSLSLILTTTRKGKPFDVKVYPHKMDGQDFYTFTWSDDEKMAYWTDPIGTFVWYPNENVITQKTYYGNGAESAWVSLSNDFRFMFQDHGTSPGPRGLSVFDLVADRPLYSGSYYRDIAYQDNRITVIKEYTSWNVKRGLIDARSISYAKLFMANNPKPEDVIRAESNGLSSEVIVQYRLDLLSLKETYIGCQYVITQ